MVWLGTKVVALISREDVFEVFPVLTTLNAAALTLHTRRKAVLGTCIAGVLAGGALNIRYKSRMIVIVVSLL
jgi:hypothetical protein